jgi:hypothetical protein
LTKVGYDDKVCDEPNTNISLVYPLDFLDDEGRWRADIKIQGSKICLDGTPISLSELGISSNKFSLAVFLLGNGVLKINGKNDPKWSQDVKFGAIFYDVWENNEGKPKELVKAILTSGSR